MNRKQLQELYNIEQQDIENRLIDGWAKDIADAVIAKAKTGAKLHVVRYWQGQLTESKKEKLLARLRGYFLEDVAITPIDVSESHEIMLVVDWA